jgi:hypothetical protein
MPSQHGAVITAAKDLLYFEERQAARTRGKDPKSDTQILEVTRPQRARWKAAAAALR